MKYYSFDYENSGEFILNYRIENNQIIINLASGKKYITPYSIDTERRLLRLMKNQVNNAKYYERKQKESFSKALNHAIYGVLFLILDIILLVTGSAINNILIALCAIWFAFVSFLNISIMIYSKLDIKDIKKNKLFVNNEELLSDNTKVNERTLTNVSSKTKELVASTPLERPIFTLNSIDKISYRDLKQILTNIKLEEQLNKTSDETALVLSRKRK